MTAKKHTWRDIWILISIGILLLYLLFLIYPLFSLLQQSVMGPEGFTLEYFQKFFLESLLFQYAVELFQGIHLRNCHHADSGRSAGIFLQYV